MRPTSATVGRLIHSIAVGDVGAHVGFTRADINDSRVARCYRNRADRADVLSVENRPPRSPGVVALPNAAVNRPKVKVIRFAGDAGYRKSAAAAKRPDEPPVQATEIRRIEEDRGKNQRQQAHHRRLPSATAVATSPAEIAAAARIAETAATPVAAARRAGIGLSRITLPAGGVGTGKASAGIRRDLTGLGRRDRAASAPEKLVAEPRPAQAPEQTTPEAAAAAEAAITITRPRTVPGSGRATRLRGPGRGCPAAGVTRGGSAPHEGSQDQESAYGNDDPPEHWYVASSRRSKCSLVRGARRTGCGLTNTTGVRAIDAQQCAHRAGDPGIVVRAANLIFHCRANLAHYVGRKPAGLGSGAIGQDDVAPIVARDEDQNAIYRLL